MKTLSLVGRMTPGDTKWRYAMDYETACMKYKQEIVDLQFLEKRLKKTTLSEFERVSKNIESRRTSIDLLKKWFKFTRNKIPEIDNK